MRRTSNNEFLDNVLKEHYEVRYKEFIEFFKTKSADEIKRLCQIKRKSIDADIATFDKNRVLAENDVSAANKMALKINEESAYLDAAKKILNMGSVN